MVDCDWLLQYSEEAQEGDDCNEEEPEDNPLGDIDPHIRLHGTDNKISVYTHQSLSHS